MELICHGNLHVLTLPAVNLTIYVTAGDRRNVILKFFNISFEPHVLYHN
jgi:hypothetical protein